MLNRILIAGFLCFTGFFIYWWSIAFDEDLRSQKGSLAYYLLTSIEVNAAAQMYEQYFLAQNCRRHENEFFAQLSRAWKCRGGKYEFSASPDIMRNDAGEYVENGKHAVHVAFNGVR